MTKLACRLILTAAALSTGLTACGGSGADASAPTTTAGADGTPPTAAANGAATGQAARTSASTGSAAGATARAANSAGSSAATARGTAAAPPAGAAGTQSAATAAAGTAATATAGAGATATTAAGAAGSVSAAGAAGATAATATAGTAAAAAGGSAQDASASCVTGLKKLCEMHETAGCSSVNTVDVGSLVKATEIPLGPYGAIMETNVGKGFEVPEDSAEADCASVAASFGEPENTTKNILDLKGSDLKLYTVYRPACMREGETYPVITWGNGTCGQTEGYGSLLRYVASYGYVVFASNSRYTGSNGAMSKALDFAEAANADESSVYYKRLDLENIGAMGHSQGGGATVTAADDKRVDSLIIWNATASGPKPFLAVSGDADITGLTPASMKRSVDGSSQPSAWLYYHKVPMTGSVSGHLTLMIQPERVVAATVAWWDLMLKKDAKAKDFFVGASCKLCDQDSDFEFGEKGLQ